MSVRKPYVCAEQKPDKDDMAKHMRIDNKQEEENIYEYTRKQRYD